MRLEPFVSWWDEVLNSVERQVQIFRATSKLDKEMPWIMDGDWGGLGALLSSSRPPPDFDMLRAAACRLLFLSLRCFVHRSESEHTRLAAGCRIQSNWLKGVTYTEDCRITNWVDLNAPMKGTVLSLMDPLSKGHANAVLQKQRHYSNCTAIRRRVLNSDVAAAPKVQSIQTN